jgi:excisionase family DNA binding protein
MEVTIAEAARLLKLSERTVRRRLHSGELKGSQVASPGGFSWVVEISEELPVGSPDSGEMARVDALIASLGAQIDTLTTELEARRREVQELHVLLQQSQAALPAPRDRPWWKWWRRG